MTIHAFKDSGDGYYQVDVPDGQQLPEWTEGLAPCDVLEPVAQSGNDAIKEHITALESQVTDRRIREAVLGIDSGWLADINAQIAALRLQLA